jgi:thiol peroxidase
MERLGAVTLRGNPMTLVGPRLNAGDPAPDFHCVDTRLQPVTLADTGSTVRIFSVIPSIDTPVCDMQTKRFDDESSKLEEIDIYSISTDLPFAEQRYCTTFGIDDVKMISDHLDTSFGKAYGVLVPELRILTRAIFVLDRNNVIQYVEYVPEIGDHPDYEAALAKAKELVALTTT